MLKHLLIFLQEWIIGECKTRKTNGSKKGMKGANSLLEEKTSREVLQKLSERFCVAAQQLRLRHVPNFFNDKNGITTSGHFRTFAEVVEVITADVVPPDSVMGTTVHTTVDFYWALRAKQFSSDDLANLELKEAAMREAWEALDTLAWRATLRKTNELPKSEVLTTVKMHRAAHHVIEYIRRWGPVEFLTTETTEAYHKLLKAIFRACVVHLQSLPACCLAAHSLLTAA